MTSSVEARFKPQVLTRARWHLDEIWYRPIRSRRTTGEATLWRALDTTKSFELDDIQVDVRSLGCGPAVLLVHGVDGHGRQFLALMQALARLELRGVLKALMRHVQCIELDCAPVGRINSVLRGYERQPVRVTFHEAQAVPM